MSEGSPVVPGSFAPGSRIAGYLLEEQIGQGGMAVVFRAHDERLDRMVALKILAPALAADDAFRQRFIRESRAAAAVDDPHIIPVFEAGEAAGVLFIAMRFVRGGDVRSLVNQFGPLPPGRVAEIISQVASALDAAHGRGLVHRDVKPANMLLDASGGAGRPDHVYLSDFGLSKGSLQASGLTGTGTFLGTLDYISPEQIEGKPVDGRADEYALACAAFELLSGVPPFQRDEAMAVMYAQLSEPPPPLTSRRPDLPAAADAVFARALAKAPADRYGSCREFSDALREAFGIRPYDSGPSEVPSGAHPATQIVSSREETQLAGSGAASGPGQPGSGQGGQGSGQGGQGFGQGQPGSGPGGQGFGQGQPGSGQGQPGGGPGGGQFGGQPTQIAGGGHRDTAPDLTAAHWQGPPGPYGGGGGGGGGRSRRTPVTILLVVLVVLILGGGGAYAYLTLGGHGGKKGTHHRTVSLAAPGCSAATASAANVNNVANQLVNVPDILPFGVQVTPDGKFAFVVTRTTVQVYHVGPGASLTHAWQYNVANPPFIAKGATLTHDGKYLLVATGNGITIMSVQAGEQGAGSMQVGSPLYIPNLSAYQGAVTIAVSPDDQFAFLTLQSAGTMAVFNLGKAISSGAYGSSSYVGATPIGNQPVGLAVSQDGKYIYVASLQHVTGPGQPRLSVLNLAAAETNPAKALLHQVLAGCSAARVIVAPDGMVWVSSRESNYILGYSAQRLVSDPNHALIAKVLVGQTPIGLILVKGGTRMVVADTNVNNLPGAHNLAVVNVANVLAGTKPTVLGYIPTGGQPREFAVTPDGRYLIVSDNGSHQVQILDLSKLP